MSAIQQRIDKLIADQYDARFGLPYNSPSAALEASRVVKGSESYLYGLTVYSSKATAQFVMVFDAATLPAEGAVTPLVFAIAATSDREVVWIPPRYMSSGIVVCCSTTGASKTLGAADCLFDVQYV